MQNTQLSSQKSHRSSSKCPFIPDTLQMPSPKVVIFGTFPKIDLQIRKITIFQTAVKIALVDEFKWTLWQMEALGWNFSKFFEFWNFEYFRMFYSTLNIDQIRIFENDGKCRICSILEKFCGKYEYFFSKFENLTFFSSPRATKFL